MKSKQIAIVVLLVFIFIGVYAGGSKSPEKILFIGNGLTYFNDGVDTHIEKLLSSGSPSLNIEADKYATADATLKILWRDDTTHDFIENGGYDVVVLQADIPLIVDKDVDQFSEYARKFIALVREAGSEPVLFMAWSYDRVQNVKKMQLGWITMEEIAQAHDEIAEELGVEVAPVGFAMKKAMEERPDLDMLSKDLVRPSIYGTYLAANVIYATIFDKSPVGFSYLPKGYYGKVTEEEADFLQRIAWETVQEYQSQ